MILDSPSAGPFLPSRPEWTLTGTTIRYGDRPRCPIEQTPFRLIDGMWETEALVVGSESAAQAGTTRVVIRIAPETLRRWHEVGLNPLVEASAQMEEHLRLSSRHGHLTALTLL